MKNAPHDNAHTHVTGQSEYIDDRPFQKNELFCDVIYSSKSHAKIKGIHFDRALQEKNIVGVLTGKDFHCNLWGTIFKDQPLLAVETVQYVGEPIALLVGTDLISVQYAKALVEIDYEELPSIKSIDEAKAQNSFIGDLKVIKKEDARAAIATAPHQISGQITIQGADHFYLEAQCAVAYPLEDGQIEVHTSCQHPTEAQHVVAESLDLNHKDVVCIVKRMGGAFGGKESQATPFAAYVALCAQKFGCPTRLVLMRDDDMVMTGKRNPFQNDYKVGFDDNGQILGLEVKLFSDGGAYADLSTAIMERAMFHCDNAYYLPAALIEGRVCRTNFHPHTAFRGFGGPKGVATIERIIEEIAHKLKKDPLEIRKCNLYQKEGKRSLTHYGQAVENNKLPELFEELTKKSNYIQKRKLIDQFNQNKGRFLKGMSLTAVKFGISFTKRFLNQANAMTSIHQDGTVQVATGATEMGQGVNARIAALVASELGIERNIVRLMPTRTDKNANTSPTAASTGTDLNGSAALLAIRKVKYRLSELASKLFTLPREDWPSKSAVLGHLPDIKIDELEFNDSNVQTDWHSGVASYFNIIFEGGNVYHRDKPQNKISFQELVTEAYFNRISLSDYGYYKFPGLQFNQVTGQGKAFLYFTQGTALSEVTIDRDTGEVKVDSSDILMDLGRPINEGLDRGQVAGGFVQGMGWLTTENLYYNDKGRLLSCSPSTYKIPNIQDTPRNFHISLIFNEENYANVRGTKAVGEPPLLLAISVWTAIQNALTYLSPYEEKFPCLKIPATSEEVLRMIQPLDFHQ